MQKIVVAILLAAALLAGCGKTAQKQQDWHRTPLKQLSVKTGGVELDIAIPEDWEPRDAPDEGWGPKTGDPFKRPSVTVQNVSSDMASSLESAIAAAGAKPENVVRKVAKNEGYAITEAKEPSLIRATTFKRTGNTFLWCTAGQANDDGIPMFNETKQVLEKICDSVTPK
ncbi:MAG TPA: hypothetical protein VFQ65_28745 [Kofleriaceae bacterium]|nr:hypothetical protein [Kofleriaceae bacterium]